LCIKSLEEHKKSKLKKYIQKLLLIASLITVGITCPAKVISQPLSKPKINEVNLYSNKSFITIAVERTGAAVVTIDTQRYVKKRKLRSDGRPEGGNVSGTSNNGGAAD